MTDEEISAAIMDFCSRPKSTGSVDDGRRGSTGSRHIAHVAKVEKATEANNLIKEQIEKNPLPAETATTKKELKTLPPGLKYAYIEYNEAYPIIINSHMTKEQEEQLMTVLAKKKRQLDGHYLTWQASAQIYVCTTLGSRKEQRRIETHIGN